MTLDAHELQALAVQVRGLVDQVARLFADEGGDRVSRGAAAADDAHTAVDAASAVDPSEGASEAHGWSHVVRVPRTPDAVDRLDGPVRDLMLGEGFEEVDRSSDAEIARQFRATPAAGVRADVGVQLARSGRGDVVIGASASG